MSADRRMAERVLDQAPKWAHLRTLEAETVEVASTRGRSITATGPAASTLLSVRQAALRLGVHENTVRNWNDRGLLTSVRLPGSGFRRFRSSDVDRIRLGIMGALANGTTEPAYDLPSEASPSILHSDDL